MLRSKHAQIGARRCGTTALESCMVPRLPDNLQEESPLVSAKTENGMPDGAPLPKGSSRAGILVLSFFTVYILWGGTFFAMRVGVDSFPPLILAGMRHLSVGVILYPLLRWRTGIRPTAQHWRTAAISGVLLLCIGNGDSGRTGKTRPRRQSRSCGRGNTNRSVAGMGLRVALF